MDKLAHLAREEKRKRESAKVRSQGYEIAKKFYLETARFFEEKYAVLSNYHLPEIEKIIADSFSTSSAYILAREGLLQFVRDYNLRAEDENQLPEPDVPARISLPSPELDFDWFTRGSELTDNARKIRDYWLRKRIFSANDLVEGLIFSAVFNGGLNDYGALEALYRWCFSKRTISKIALSPENILLVIHLTIEDKKYGCFIPPNNVERYVQFCIDDISLAFIVAMGEKTLSDYKVQPLNTIIHNLCKRLGVVVKDIKKPWQSQFMRYANFHWRQIAEIDTALSMVQMGRKKTTALSSVKSASYQNEPFNKNITPIDWIEFFQGSSLTRKEGKVQKEVKHNIISSLKKAFRIFNDDLLFELNMLINAYQQDNIQRFLHWIVHLVTVNGTTIETAGEELLTIGQAWLTLTAGEDLSIWSDESYEDIYQQIIDLVSKDAGANEVENLIELEQQITLTERDQELYDEVLSETETEPEQKFLVQDVTQPVLNQSIVAERLKAFHHFQCKNELFITPNVDFSWLGQAQIVRANMISPNLYANMRKCLEQSLLNAEQKSLCLAILFLSYRGGFRVNELAGLKTEDCFGEKELRVIIRRNHYRSLKSDSARRFIDLHALLKPDELEHFRMYLDKQKRLQNPYLFSLTDGNPLTPVFYNRLMRVIWDRLLPEHDYTFHSFRHNAVSQLALVLRRSPLTYLMTDYTESEVNVINEALLGYNEVKGAWVGLSAFTGHLTTAPTFEYYIHTAHLIAGEQLSRVCLKLPYIVFEKLTGISKQKIRYHAQNAYDAKSGLVNLKPLRHYLAKQTNVDSIPLFVNQYRPIKIDTGEIVDKSAEVTSIFIEESYRDVIAYLYDLQASLESVNAYKLKGKARTQAVNQCIADVSLQHKIPFEKADILYKRAKAIFGEARLFQKLPSGIHFNHALERAYELSKKEPEKLKRFVAIFASRHDLKKSFLKFGGKPAQQEIMSEFVKIGCELIDAHRWQIRAGDKEKVKFFKTKFKLDNKIKVGERKNFKGFDVRVVVKKKKTSEENKAKTDSYFSADGVFKFLGYFLMIIVDYESSDTSS